MLVPSELPTRPSTGRTGDLFLDRRSRLSFCGGTTDWVRVV